MPLIERRDQTIQVYSWSQNKLHDMAGLASIETMFHTIVQSNPIHFKAYQVSIWDGNCKLEKKIAVK
jgi:hypothetical protein